MKLGPDVLLEIMNAVQYGLLTQEDVSEQLRAIDLEEQDGELVLSDAYHDREQEEE